MFDFYKELILEMQGIKPQKKLDKNREYIGDEKDKPILNMKMKIVIWFMGILYLFVAIIGIIAIMESKKYFRLIRYVLLITTDIAAIVLCTFRKRKIQIVGIGFVIAFVIINFTTTMFMR